MLKYCKCLVPSLKLNGFCKICDGLVTWENSEPTDEQPNQRRLVVGLEKWSSEDVLNYWKQIHKHKNFKWKEEWDMQFIKHPDIEFIISVDASWIRAGISSYQELSSVAWYIRNGINKENRVECNEDWRELE